MPAKKKVPSLFSGLPLLLLAAIALFISGGIILPAMTMKLKSTPVQLSKPTLKIPSDLVKISGCIPYEGEHYVNPKDLPHGPYYIIYNNKVLALEYMFSPEDIPGADYSKMSPDQFVKYMQVNKLELNDVVNELRSFNFDTPDNAEVKYVDIHWTAPHAGEIEPHYDMHMYLVEKAELDKVCPEASIDEVFTEEIIHSLIEKKIPLPQAP